MLNTANVQVSSTGLLFFFLLWSKPLLLEPNTILLQLHNLQFVVPFVMDVHVMLWH